jgi:serine/threonine protein kinase
MPPGQDRAAVALVIGISEYLRSDAVTSLRYAARDAEELARVLEDPEFCAFPHDRVAVLTQHRARRDEVVHHLSKWLPEKAKGAEVVLIYFACHGTVQTVGDRQEGFLLPYDGDPDDVVTHGIAMKDVGNWIDGIAASAVVVCLDCCHAGKVILRGPPRPRDLELSPAAIQSIGGRGRFLIASCDAGQKSLEAEELGHGLFTYHLLRGLQGAGDRDGDGRVGVSELFTYVSNAVATDAQEKFGREQRPWTSATWADEVYISRCARKEGPPDPPAPPAPGRNLGKIFAAGDDESLLKFLREVMDRGDIEFLPQTFRCLAHSCEDVRRQAKRAVRSIGWSNVENAIGTVARQGDVDDMGAILDGLAAFEAHDRTVRLLNRLVAMLHGDLRNRTILLLERKKLGLELEKVSNLFRDVRSPYKIEKALGQGLFTAAYLASDEGTGHKVVVRVLRDEFACKPGPRAQFIDLGHRSVPLVHHNLVLTREARAFPEQDIYYTVHDHIDGVTLQRLLDSRKVFESIQILEIVRQLLDALGPYHEHGLCHGGIKPSNIFITDRDRVVLGDPGLAVEGVALAMDRLSYDYRYAPPEMFKKGVPLEPRSDFYSLGCVAYELACGEPPFVSDNFWELAAKHGREPIPPPASRGSSLGENGDQFLLCLLSATPAERFDTLSEARAALCFDRPAAQTLPEVLIKAAIPAARATPARLLRDESLLNAREEQSVVSFSQTTLSISLEKVDRSTLDGSEDAWSIASLNALVLIVGEHYELLDQIGQGGMSRVYKARDRRLGREVALKILPWTTSDQAHRFAGEAEALARLNHLNIVPIYEASSSEAGQFIAMRLMRGGTLGQHLEDYLSNPRGAVMLLEKTARAVQYAHEQGIIHRDLKPGNILLDANGEPHITDFGLAKFQRETDVQATQSVQVSAVGTPAYMAPEQWSGDATSASDIYSLGAILYQLLTGRRPFTKEKLHELVWSHSVQQPARPRTIRPTVDRDLEAICLRCLEKEPIKRYASAGALAEDLARWLDGEPITARPIGTVGKLQKWARRKAWWPF